jgi:hypothetical protein
MPFAESKEKYDKMVKIYVHEKCNETGLKMVDFKANKATIRLKKLTGLVFKVKTQ